MENTEVVSTDTATHTTTYTSTNNATDTSTTHISDEFRSKPSYYIPGTCIDCGTTNICRDYDIKPSNGGDIVSSCDFCWSEGGSR